MKRLALHTDILPSVTRALAGQGEPHPYGDTDFAADQLSCLSNAMIFDCRRLDAEFVSDTGAAARHEMEQTNDIVRPPFPCCYFEFADGVAVLSVETDHFGATEEKLGTSVQYRTYFGWSAWDNGDWQGASSPTAEFPNGVCIEDETVAPFWTLMNSFNPADDVMADRGGDHLIGVLSLLSEKLLASEFQPDPEPALTRARLKRGRLPLSADSHVLTLNLAAIRSAARPPSIGSHESPRLHWRRGHWRALHRGSEFESKAWVRRCLVGDPTRGAIHKDYRLAWRQPLLAASGVAA